MSPQREIMSIDDAKDAYDRALARHTLEAACKRRYVRTSLFVDWLKSKVDICKDGKVYTTSQANLLLLAAYRNHVDNEVLPIRIEKLSNGKHQCLLIFSILFEMGLGHFIHEIFRQDRIDRHLPIAQYVLQQMFRELGADICDEAKRFDELQWKFCAVQFELDMARDLLGTNILPICRREEIKVQKGGTAKLWEIEVLEGFVREDLRARVKNSRYEPDDGLGPRYHFALKVFEEGSRYENEKKAFHALQNQSGIVRYLGEYTQQPENSKDEDLKTTYNILLEYGIFDLSDFFVYRLPPVFPGEIETFWNNLFDVAYALDRLHNLKIKSDGVMNDLLGWHGDIKPDNIILFEEDVAGTTGERFKLADPGFAKFVPRSQNIEAVILDGKTITYSPPESCGEAFDSPCFQTFDTWSLACVFSVAATWVVLGLPGTKYYIRVREKAIESRIKDDKTNQEMRSLPKSDCFHDGTDVLSEVLDWHNFLRNAARKTDLMTERVLDWVDEILLASDPKKRATTKSFCAMLKRISNETRSKLSSLPDIKESIVQLLHELDKEAEGEASSELIIQPPTSTKQMTASESRRNLQSKIRNAPLQKTANRYEYLKSGPRSTRQSPLREHPRDTQETFKPRTVTPNAQAVSLNYRSSENSSIAPRHQLVSQIEIPKATRLNNGSRDESLSPPMRRKIIAPPQYMQQARKDSDSSSKPRSIARRVAAFMRNSPKKDDLFKQFFENRDIVFLIDNGWTMREFWEEATELLKTLVTRCVRLDPDGMDLRFTNGFVTVNKKDDPKSFMTAMKNPDAMPSLTMLTDIRDKLSEIIQDHLRDAENQKRRNSKPKYLTLIIFTDGIWQGTPVKEQVRRKIIELVTRTIEVIGELKLRPVSIEFVQFGNDVDATYRLKALDNHWDYDGIPDIVDTTRSDGDLDKVMLGSFVEAYDLESDDDEESCGPDVSSASPDQQSYIFESPSPRQVSQNQHLVSEDERLNQAAERQPPASSSRIFRRQTSESNPAPSNEEISEDPPSSSRRPQSSRSIVYHLNKLRKSSK